MPKALKLTEANVGRVMAAAELLGMNLSHLPDEMEYNAENGHATYLITDGDNIRYNLTYTTMIDDDFNRIWRFDPTRSDWQEIERN